MARPATPTRLGLHLAGGQRVGLYGGSFNPAHAGHAHVAETALRRLRLDKVVWLVSPQNPLKPDDDTEALAARLAGAAHFARGPRMVVSDAETKLGTQFTIDTVLALKARHPRVRFVWIMGADSLAGFHRWRDWRRILREAPVAVVSRPGQTLTALSSPAARRFAFARLAPQAAAGLALRRPPAWVFLSAPLNDASSTALRRHRAAATAAPP